MVEDLRQKITDIALSFIGEQEIRGNKGFKNDRFEKLMEDVGWQMGQSWCAYFCEMVWKLAYEEINPEQIPLLDDLFSAGAVATYNNFNDSDLFLVNKTPAEGAVVIWQNYKDLKPTWMGHAGIVINYSGKNISTVEGNTNASGGREGIEVALKIRSLSFVKKNGLVLKGFIHPTII